jgi:hypothetical protein
MSPLIQIPKTASSPADPNEPCFLMSLPAEICNYVYAFVFKHDKPVLLHDTELYYSVLPTQSVIGAPYSFKRALDQYDASIEEDEAGTTEF